MPEPQPDASLAGGPRLLRPRRELFEHGLLPIPKLIFADGALTLGPLKATLPARVDAQALADALLIPLDHALLALETLGAVLPADRGDADPSSADAHDVVLFLYVQSYKRLVPRGGHKDSPAVADVWPSNSAFDGYLSAMSPLQLARSNSRRFMPSQVDEEAHQLSYLQKHMANILSLLAEPEGGNDESLVLTPERFQHLELLIQFAEKGFEGVPLSHAVPLFENSDPVMPAVPVPAAQVLDWVLQTIASSLEHILEKATTKENGTVNSADMDVMATDACTSTRAQTSSSLSGTSIHNSATYCRSQTFVEGISKASVVKQACDISGHSVKVLNCHDCVIYILAPLRYATVYGCSDVTVVLGAIGKAVRVEHCERVQVITAAKRICIANCRECVFFLGVNQQPLILGDNHKLQVAPYNTFYPQLEEHMAQVGIDATINRWDKPLVVGMVDPHDSLSHPAGVSDVQAESATCLDADQFTNFMIPKWFGVESTESKNHNPFPLPDNYIASQTKNHSLLNDIQQVIRNAQLEDSRKREVAYALHVHFKDWLYASGNIRQLYCLQE